MFYREYPRVCKKQVKILSVKDKRTGRKQENRALQENRLSFRGIASSKLVLVEQQIEAKR